MGASSICRGHLLNQRSCRPYTAGAGAGPAAASTVGAAGTAGANTAVWDMAVAAAGTAAAGPDTAVSDTTAVAGAGMYGTHTFRYLTELSDDIGARVTGSPEAARAVEWGVETMKAMGLENVHAEHYQLWRGWTRGTADAWLLAPTRRKLLRLWIKPAAGR